MTAFIKPIKYVPVFAGRTEADEKIVLYNRLGNDHDLFIKRPDGEFWALYDGSVVEMTFDPTDATMNVSIRSDVWTGSAEGTRRDLIEEEAIR